MRSFSSRKARVSGNQPAGSVVGYGMGRLVPQKVPLFVAAIATAALLTVVLAVAPFALGAAVLAFSGDQPHSCGGP